MIVAEDLIKDKNTPLVSVPTSTTLAEAVRVMKDHNVGSLLVSGDSTLVGIWTERDLLRNIADHGFGIESERIETYMSSPLITCQWDDSVYKLFDMILGLRIRHILVSKQGEYIGLISAGDVMKASIRAKNLELAEANANRSWEYYEEWRWPEGGHNTSTL